MSISLVAATQPISGGKAPGIAPTIVLKDEILFNGVYIKT